MAPALGGVRRPASPLLPSGRHERGGPHVGARPSADRPSSDEGNAMLRWLLPKPRGRHHFGSTPPARDPRRRGRADKWIDTYTPKRSIPLWPAFKCRHCGLYGCGGGCGDW